MSSMNSPINTLLRPIFEARSAVAWSIAALWCIVVSLLFQIGVLPSLGLIAVTISMAVYRGMAA